MPPLKIVPLVFEATQRRMHPFYRAEVANEVLSDFDASANVSLLCRLTFVLALGNVLTERPVVVGDSSSEPIYLSKGTSRGGVSPSSVGFVCCSEDDDDIVIFNCADL